LCPEKGNARTIAFNLGWSSQTDEMFGFETGDSPRKSPFEEDIFEFEVGFIMKRVKEIFLFL